MSSLGGNTSTPAKSVCSAVCLHGTGAGGREQVYRGRGRVQVRRHMHFALSVRASQGKPCMDGPLAWENACQDHSAPDSFNKLTPQRVVCAPCSFGITMWEIITGNSACRPQRVNAACLVHAALIPLRACCAPRSTALCATLQDRLYTQHAAVRALLAVFRDPVPYCACCRRAPTARQDAGAACA